MRRQAEKRLQRRGSTRASCATTYHEQHARATGIQQVLLICCVVAVASQSQPRHSSKAYRAMRIRSHTILARLESAIYQGLCFYVQAAAAINFCTTPEKGIAATGLHCVGLVDYALRQITSPRTPLPTPPPPPPSSLLLKP